MDKLICFFDDYNGAAIYAALNLKPKDIIFLIDDREAFYEDFASIKEHLIKKLPGVNVQGVILKEPYERSISQFIRGLKGEEIWVNLSGGSRLLNLIAFKLCLQLDIPAVYADMQRESIFEVSGKEIRAIDCDIKDMTISDLIASSGGKSLQESSRFFMDKRVLEMMGFILNNYPRWFKLKQLLRNNYYIEYNDFWPLKVVIREKAIKDFSIFMPFFKKGKELGIFNYYEKGGRLNLEFTSMEYKSFIFKIGTWLEVLTYNDVKELEGINEAKAGVVFLWDIDKERIKNEADVLATSGSRLIYISCKDTPNYDEEDLNELEVYSNKIGGEDTVKILVATSAPNKSTTLLRAEEMNINILIFKGDVEDFKKKLQKLIL